MSPGNRRLFFAFWPDARLCGTLETARKRLFPLSGRPVDPANLHITAAFLGTVSDTRLEALSALSGPVSPLTIQLDRLEHWPKQRVLVAATTHAQDDVHQVVGELWRRLDRLGFARDPRTFKPHVTLVRDVRSVRPNLPWTRLAWPVDRVELVESVSGPEGVRYAVIAPPKGTGP